MSRRKTLSFNRENVVWKAENGTWNRGFFANYQIGDDPEWDVEYDFDRFEWVSTGHPSEQAARASWKGANPGTCMTYYLADEDIDMCRHFDEMAAECPMW